MTDEEMPSRLWQETQRAAEVWEKTRGPRRASGDQPAEPASVPSTLTAGQVLILPALGEPRLAWAVVRREPGEDARLLLVAADVNPLVGTGDLAVTGPAIGLLTARCRFAVWASERKLDATALLTTLPPEVLSRADSRCQAIATGQPVGTFSEQETEEDPEYQDWIEDIVRPAVGKLQARAGAEAPSPLPVLPFPIQRPVPPSSPRGAWMRWAAVLAFVALGTVSSFLGWRQAQEIAGLRAAADASESVHSQVIAELEASRAALETQYQARLQKVGADRARLEVEHREQLQALSAQIEKLRQATDVKNPLLAALEPEAIRRGPMRLVISPEVSHLVLLLPVKDPEGTEFQIEVDEQPSGKRVFVQNGLRADVLGEVRLGLPAALLPSGDYRLRLFRKAGDKLHLVREHLIEIDEEGPR